MYTARKRQLKKKNFFLTKQKTFVLFNGSNLKTYEINKIKIALINAKLYFMPSYLTPPQIALGYPIIIIVYKNIEDLRKNIPKIVKKIDCIGISINKKWYSTNFLKEENLKDLDYKILSLLVKKNESKK